MKAVKGILWIGLIVALFAQAGCNMLAYPAMLAAEAQTEKVPAEFSRLADKKVAIVVWSDAGTLYQFPHIRLELASQLAYQMAGQLKTVSIVAPQEIADYQSRNPNWDAMPAWQIGRQFEADYVIFVEILEYSTREPRTPGLFHGMAKASVVVHDVADPTARWTLTPVSADFPLRRTTSMNSDDQMVHRQLIEMLAGQITTKFYEHEVSKHQRDNERKQGLSK